jgi:hypothetical protein
MLSVCCVNVSVCSSACIVQCVLHATATDTKRVALGREKQKDHMLVLLLLLLLLLLLPYNSAHSGVHSIQQHLRLVHAGD